MSSRNVGKKLQTAHCVIVQQFASTSWWKSEIKQQAAAVSLNIADRLSRNVGKKLQTAHCVTYQNNTVLIYFGAEA